MGLGRRGLEEKERESQGKGSTRGEESPSRGEKVTANGLLEKAKEVLYGEGRTDGEAKHSSDTSTREKNFAAEGQKTIRRGFLKKEVALPEEEGLSFNRTG